MKVLLVDIGEHYGKDPGRDYIYQMRKAEPIGLLSLAAYLQAAGHEVRVVSPIVYIYDVFYFDPDVVGISVMSWQHNIALDMARTVKVHKSSAKVVLGGPHPSGYPEIVLDSNIDTVVIGEGELAFSRYLTALENGVPLKEAQGIAFEHSGSLVITSPSPLVEDLDSLPFSLRTKKFLDRTKMGLIDYDVDGTLSPRNAQISSSRGCPYNCNFCLSSKMWRCKVRFRSSEKVVDEIVSIKSNFGITFFAFNDLTFNLNAKHVHQLCDEMIRRKVDIHWHCLCNPVLGDNELYQKMAEAGCIRIGWGIEASLSLRERYSKPQGTISRMIATLRASDQVGILNRGFIMLGHPEETEEDIVKTQRMIQSMPLDDLSGRFVTPFPGTALWEQYKDQLIVRDCWPFFDFTTYKPIIKSPHFSPEELVERQIEFARTFYTSRDYCRRRESKIKRFPHLENSFRALSQDMSKKGIM